MKYVIFVLLPFVFGSRPRTREKHHCGRGKPLDGPKRFELDQKETKDEFNEIIESYRLPRNSDDEPALLPLHYYVDLITYGLKEADRDEEGYFRYSGSMVVNVTCNKATKYIVLHSTSSLRFSIDSVKLDGMEPAEWSIIPEKEYLVITNNLEWVIGTVHEIEVVFQGQIRKGIMGFYEESYTDGDGEIHYLATFPTMATRLMFPCFDEPGLKAKFTFRVSYKYKGQSTIWSFTKNSFSE